MKAFSHAISRDCPNNRRLRYTPGLHSRPSTILIGARTFCESVPGQGLVHFIFSNILLLQRQRQRGRGRRPRRATTHRPRRRRRLPPPPRRRARPPKIREKPQYLSTFVSTQCGWIRPMARSIASWRLPTSKNGSPALLRRSLATSPTSTRQSTSGATRTRLAKGLRRATQSTTSCRLSRHSYT